MHKTRLSYSLFSENILQNLEEKTYFIEAIAYSYNLTALHYGTNLSLSQLRLMEAYEYWQEDATRIIERGMPEHTTSLDHFKHASFIAFWLRRTIPINGAFGDPTWLEARGEREGVRRKEFYRYANEICALKVGLDICTFYESGSIQPDEILPVNGYCASRLDWLKSIEMPNMFLKECATIMKHKNLSPYSMYMLYRSLFTNLHATRDWTLGPID